METVISLVLGFILTGLIGNWLVQAWQQRTWLKQQRFLGDERDYNALKELWDDMVSLSGARLTRMRRLSAVVRRSDVDLVIRRLSEYDESILRWNEQFGSFLVRLLRYTSSTDGLANTLEKTIQPHFVQCGRQLELLVKQRQANAIVERSDVEKVTKGLDLLSHALIVFNRDMLKVVDAQKKRTYEGVKIELSRETIPQFRNWELFKALFHGGINRFYVIRPTFDIPLPS